MKVIDIYDMLDDWAPFASQVRDHRMTDNAGLLIGDPQETISGVTVCLDITAEVVRQAVQNDCNLIVSHHPVIFSPMKTLPAGSVPYLLAQNGISAICAHTNLDAAAGGVNDTLAGALGLNEVVPLAEYADEQPPMARVGHLKNEYSAAELAAFVKDTLGCGMVRYTPAAGGIRRLALCGGSGADYLIAAKHAGAQALLTGEAKHHELLLARELDICLMDAGHFCTEHLIVNEIVKKLSARFGSVRVNAAKESEPALYL